jgi:hypothetical protein
MPHLHHTPITVEYVHTVLGAGHLDHQLLARSVVLNHPLALTFQLKPEHATNPSSSSSSKAAIMSDLKHQEQNYLTRKSTAISNQWQAMHCWAEVPKLQGSLPSEK